MIFEHWWKCKGYGPLGQSLAKKIWNAAQAAQWQDLDKTALIQARHEIDEYDYANACNYFEAFIAQVIK